MKLNEARLRLTSFARSVDELIRERPDIGSRFEHYEVDSDSGSQMDCDAGLRTFEVFEFVNVSEHKKGEDLRSIRTMPRRDML